MPDYFGDPLKGWLLVYVVLLFGLCIELWYNDGMKEKFSPYYCSICKRKHNTEEDACSHERRRTIFGKLPNGKPYVLSFDERRFEEALLDFKNSHNVDESEYMKILKEIERCIFADMNDPNNSIIRHYDDGKF